MMHGQKTIKLLNKSTEHFIQHKASGKVILLLDGHRAHRSFLLLLQTTVENSATIIRPPYGL
jgi:hypothetical protein